MLIFGFQLTAVGNNNRAEQEENQVSFGDGIMEVENTASTNNGNIDVGLSTANSNIAYISYEKFNDSFTHDPILGIEKSNLSSYLIIGGIAAFVVVVLVIYTRKSKN